MELWRRKQALIVWEWDLQNVESDEENRPEFETSAKNFRTNPVTKEKEPYIPTHTKVFRYFVTASVVTMMVRAWNENRLNLKCDNTHKKMNIDISFIILV